MKFKIRITGEMSGAQHFTEFKKDAKKLWKAAEAGKLGEHDSFYEIGVPDLSWIGKIPSPEKLRLLMVVRDKKPQSLYELAQLLGRAASNVFRDAQELAGFGILELSRTQREGREQDVMRPEFPWDGFEIEMEKRKKTARQLKPETGHSPRSNGCSTLEAFKIIARLRFIRDSKAHHQMRRCRETHPARVLAGKNISAAACSGRPAHTDPDSVDLTQPVHLGYPRP